MTVDAAWVATRVLAAHNPGWDVGTAITAGTDVVVEDAGGSIDQLHHVDNARLDVRCYAAAREAAWDVADAALTALLAPPSQPDCTITRTVCERRPFFFPDPADNRPAYLFTVRWTLHEE